MHKSSIRVAAKEGRASRSSRLPVSVLRPSADLAGRSVALSIDVPAAFDVPLAPHHRMIGSWVAQREGSERRLTRPEARALIERRFNREVLAILQPVELADLRVAALHGDGYRPPAIAVICDSIGQIDLGWIEKSNVLSNTLFGSVAPVRWRATAYKTLEETLPGILPVFGYDRLVDELSAYYWDGEIDDAAARQALIDYHGHSEEDVELMTLPSGVNARRPDYMLASNTTALRNLPAALRDRIRAVRDAHKELERIAPEGSAWFFDWHRICEYLPVEDNSTLPPMTLVPFEHFAQELDDVARWGMESGFMDVAGLCELTDADKIDAWFASLKLGVDLLLAAQALIDFDPTKI